MTGAVLNTLGFGNRPEDVEIPVIQTRPPASSDVMGAAGPYPLGKRWIDKVDGNAYTLVSTSSVGGSVTANWALESLSAAAPVSGSTAVTLNAAVGSVTFTGASITGGASQAFTIDNSFILGSSTLVLYSLTGTKGGAAISIESIANSPGVSVVTVTNGSGALAQNVPITLTFIVLG